MTSCPSAARGRCRRAGRRARSPQRAPAVARPGRPRARAARRASPSASRAQAASCRSSSAPRGRAGRTLGVGHAGAPRCGRWGGGRSARAGSGRRSWAAPRAGWGRAGSGGRTRAAPRASSADGWRPGRSSCVHPRSRTPAGGDSKGVWAAAATTALVDVRHQHFARPRGRHPREVRMRAAGDSPGDGVRRARALGEQRRGESAGDGALARPRGARGRGRRGMESRRRAPPGRGSGAPRGRAMGVRREAHGPRGGQRPTRACGRVVAEPGSTCSRVGSRRGSGSVERDTGRDS